MSNKKIGRPSKHKGGTVISTFSYPVDSIPIVERARHIAEEDGKSFSDLVAYLIEEFVRGKKAIGESEPTPIGVRFSSGTPENGITQVNNSRQLSLLDFTTVPEAYHKLQDNGIFFEDLNDLTRYCQNFIAAVTKYRPNAAHRMVTAK